MKTRKYMMITDKVGNKSYLGIEINYDKESKLDKFSLDTLKDRYLWEKESHAQEAFARASVFLSLIHISEPTRPERIGVGGGWG